MNRQSHRIYGIAALFILLGIYVFVFSESGILERRILESKKDKLASRISDLKESNESLQKEHKKYLSGVHPDSEFQKSGYVGRGEKILFFKGPMPEDSASSTGDKSDESHVDIGHLRMIWIIFSSVVMIFIFSRRPRGPGTAHE